MVRFALRNPHAVVVMGLAILIFGVTAANRIPSDLLPVFTAPAVQILTFYPGMPAETVERDITTRLERWTGQANGVARQESKSMIGVSIVKDYFRPDIDPNTAMSLVTSLAMSDLYYLPPGTVPPMIMPFDPTATMPLALLTVSSPTFDETKLYDVAYFDLRNRLQGITGVIAPAVYGGKLRRILAYVDRDKLQARGLSPMDVVKTIKSYNLMIPTGDAKLGSLDYQINANGMVDTVDEINGFPIKVDGGGAVFIKDVAHTEDSNQIQTNIVRINGKRQVYIPIYRQPGANTIQIVDGVREAIGRILQRLPKGIDLNLVMDQSIYVRQAIANLVEEGVLGAILAALTILLFLGSFRSMGIALVALPLSILAAIAALFFSGHSLNAMTLGGLTLAVGLLVDHTIVVLENISRHMDLGKTPFEAALDGTREVATPVLIIKLTIAAALLPVVFLTGIGKFLFSSLAVSLAFALAASYILAITLTPACASRFLKSGNRNRRFELWFDPIRDRYGRFLRAIVAHAKTVVAFSLVVFIGSFAVYPFIGTELFPQVDAGQLLIRLRAPSGTRVEVTESTVENVEDTIRQNVSSQDLSVMISNIGVLNDWPAAYTPNSGPMDAFINLQFAQSRKHTAQEYAEHLREKLRGHFPEIEFSFDTGGLITAALNGGLPSAIDIQVEGNDLRTASNIARRIQEEIRKVPGAEDVRIQQKLDYPQIEVNVDRVKAANLGLTQENVVKNVVTTLNSSINFDPSFWIDHRNGNHYFIGAQYREKDIDSLETLKNIPINGAQTEPVLLRNIARFTTSNASAEVNHLNITRMIDVFANVHGRDIGSVAAAIESRLKNVQLPEGYFVRMRGEVQSMRESFGSLGFGLLLAIMLVYLVMVIQFRSFMDPFIVMFAVPLGLVGVLWMLFLTGTYLSIQSMMGVIMMVGVVVAFSLLMVDFANRLRAEGRGLEESIIEAATIRLRPIVMTSLAATLGLVPMAISGGANIPLARAVIGGVLASTALTLVVVPVLYVLLKRRRRGFPVLPALLLLIAILPACRGSSAQTQASNGTAAPSNDAEVVDVQAVHPEHHDFERRVSIPGSIEAFEQTTLYAKTAGYLRSIHVDGDRVHEGEVIAEIDVPEMTNERDGALAEAERASANIVNAEAELERSRAEVELKKVSYERLQSVRNQEPDVLPQQDVDEAKAHYNVALAAVKLAESKVKVSQSEKSKAEASLARLSTMIEYSKIRAPFDGVVTKRYVDRGALIQQALSQTNVSPVATVARTDMLRIFVDVAEPDVPFIKKGNPVTIAVDAFPGQSFEGRSTRFTDALDPKTRTMKVEIDLPNRNGLLLPGMYGRVDLTLEKRASTLSIPAGALVTDGGKTYVYTVVDGKAKRVEVGTGLDDGTHVEVTKGLNAADLVIVAGKNAVTEGKRVKL